MISQNETTAWPGMEKMSGGFRRWFPWLVLGALWISLIRQLWLEWSTNEDYSYGFVVPLLALYLFSKRWDDRPEPRKPEIPDTTIVMLLSILSVFLLPIRLIQESNPEWRLVSWFLAGVVVAVSLGLIYFVGGKSWAAHFAFPVAFIFTAVPWPTVFEAPLTGLLMRFGAGASVFLLNWMGIPATQNGNVIEAAGGLVGISEACSGIRSLQITLMISLFFGELYRFGALRRLILLLLVGVVALTCNLGRTFFLAWMSVHYGNAVMEKWHDTAGFAVLAIALTSFWGVAGWMNRSRVMPETSVAARKPGAPRAWPIGFLVGFMVWFLAIQAATEIWYRVNESSRPAAVPAWGVTWPESRPGFHQIEIPDRTRAILKFSSGRQASWSDGGRLNWSVFFFQWAPGRTSAILAKLHKPEICLPAIGCHLVRSGDIRVVSVNGRPILFHSYVFEQNQRLIYVWWCLWEGDGSPRATEFFQVDETTNDYKAILASVLAGRRNAGQQILEIALSGARSDAEADAALAGLLPGLIVEGPGGPQRSK